MYFVDRKKIEEILQYMNELLEEVINNNFQTGIEKMGLERITHVLIESALDVGNMMIDGFIMRDPGSYEDIIDILIDEKVIPERQEEIYKQFIGLRKSLVTDYMMIDHKQLEIELKEYAPTLKEFSNYIQAYLKNELGVANAFIPENEK
ncbi:DUF86 domain-containing protein [Oceanobacillus sp. FSL H7-0719]|uniref:DUF86 domain-containing protein n=1 Tax=Oceanobacillus sp. FSL H7-0719 TaxID=2954507 RepID=UPI003244160D